MTTARKISAYEGEALKFVHAIAEEYGVSVTDDEAEMILWNDTGWPCFWPSRQNPNIALRVQLREFFAAGTET